MTGSGSDPSGPAESAVATAPEEDRDAPGPAGEGPPEAPEGEGEGQGPVDENPAAEGESPVDEGEGQGPSDENPSVDPASIPGAPDPLAGEYRMAIVSSVTVDLPNQYPTVVLRETESPRRQLSFSVGLPDGIALSHALRRVPTPRPLTHELLAEVLAAFDVDVVAVRLVGRQGATYFAELDLRGRTGRSVHSCRPTDALTLALRQPVPVPILIDARLFETRGDVTPPAVD